MTFTDPRARLPLTGEERRRLGGRLRGLRHERHWRVADLAVHARLAENTIVAIEHGHARVRLANLEKVAAVFATSIDAILAPLVDTRLVDLNDEHLAMAIAYRNARKNVRATMEALATATLDARVVGLLPQILLLATALRLEALAWAVTDPDGLLEQWGRIRTRLVHDPSYWTLLEGALATEDVITPLAKPRPRSASRASSDQPLASAPSRRA